LKLLYARARPAPWFDYPLPASYSFPSGHALFAACFFGGLAVLLSHRLVHRWARIVTWLAALFFIGIIGVSRVYLGVHYPSDIVGGWTIGLLWVAAVRFGDRLSERRRERRRRQRAEVAWE
nr:phosphatase PAP2 family protein [Gemmatimonadales bacterium]